MLNFFCSDVERVKNPAKTRKWTRSGQIASRVLLLHSGVTTEGLRVFTHSQGGI